MCNKIEAFQVADKSWRIKVNGKRRSTYYKSVPDIREFVGACQAHGLFIGYELYVKNEAGGIKKIDPTYNNPCEMPAIAKR